MNSTRSAQQDLLKEVLKDEAIWDDFFYNPQGFARQHGVDLDAATIASIHGHPSSVADDLNGPRTAAQWPAAIAAVSATVVAATSVVQAATSLMSSIRTVPVDTGINRPLNL